MTTLFYSLTGWARRHRKRANKRVSSILAQHSSFGVASDVSALRESHQYGCIVDRLLRTIREIWDLIFLVLIFRAGLPFFQSHQKTFRLIRRVGSPCSDIQDDNRGWHAHAMHKM